MASTILIQGMRRSGTTILYDAMLEDPELQCFYEPWREDTDTPGGGSGARETRPVRRDPRAAQAVPRRALPGPATSTSSTAAGRATRRWSSDPEVPEHCAGFLRTLLERNEPTMIKETRFYDKLEAIRGIAPDDTVLVHVVRDPRAVAASMMMGRERKRAEAYSTPEAFFDEREKRKLWSSRQLSQLLLKRPEYSHLRRPPNFMRILMVWKHTFESTWREGRLLFGDRYVLLRNEELRADPVGAISRVYRAVDRPTPPAVAEWARGKVKAPEVPFAATDPRWAEAFAALGMREALADAGYPGLAETAGAARAPGRLSGLMGRARTRMGRARAGNGA